MSGMDYGQSVENVRKAVSNDETTENTDDYGTRPRRSRGAISSGAATVDVCLDELGKALADLAELIDPVLAPSTPSPTDGSAKSPGDDVDLRSDVAKQFDNQAAKVRMFTAKVRALSARVDI